MVTVLCLFQLGSCIAIRQLGTLVQIHTSFMYSGLPTRVCSPLQVLCDANLLGSMGLPWLAQLLCAVFSLLSLPSSTSSLSASTSSITQGGLLQAPHQSLGMPRPQLLRMLRTLPLLPLRGGGFTSLAQQQHPSQTDGSRQNTVARGGVAASREQGGPTPVFFWPLDPLLQSVKTAKAATDGGPAGVAPAAAPRPVGSVAANPASQAQTATETMLQAIDTCLGPVEGLEGVQFLDPGLLEAAAAGVPAEQVNGQQGFSGGGASQLALLIQGLQEIGVRELSALDVMQHTVLPRLTAPDAPQQLQPQAVVGLLAFPLMSGLLCPPGTSLAGAQAVDGAADSDLLASLRECALVCTQGSGIVCVGSSAGSDRPASTGGSTFRAAGSQPGMGSISPEGAPQQTQQFPSACLFPPSLGNTLDWAHEFAEYGSGPTQPQWVVLSDAYAQFPAAGSGTAAPVATGKPGAAGAAVGAGSREQQGPSRQQQASSRCAVSVAQWCWLLGELGVGDMLPVVPRTVHMDGAAALAASPWVGLRPPSPGEGSTGGDGLSKVDGVGKGGMGAGTGTAAGSWVVRDWESPLLQALVRHLAEDRCGSPRALYIICIDAILKLAEGHLGLRYFLLMVIDCHACHASTFRMQKVHMHHRAGMIKAPQLAGVSAAHATTTLCSAA